MAMTESTMLELGVTAPDFSLISTEGQKISRDDFKDAKALVVMFICNHCPYVIHVAPELAKLASEYMKKDVAFVAINSNDVEAYPADSMEKMVIEKAQRGYEFPYLIDDKDQSTAKAYTAACTPDFYLFDKDFKLVYRGQMDDTRPHRISSGNYDSSKAPANGKDLRQALDKAITGEAIEGTQYPSIGCNIKWKPNNEPDYYG